MEAVLRHLVILAHPGTRSFNRSIAETYMAALEENGHRATCRDLYAMDFNPVLSTRDMAVLARGTLPRDIRAELSAIRTVDAITLVSPLWWRGFPAILKGYIDRVFTAGSGYLSSNGMRRPSLSGRKGAIIMTAESGADELRRGGTLRALKIDHKETLEYCGMEIVGELYLGGITPTMSRSEGERHLDAVRRFARRTFS